ncbi:hypothetical protein [uncultured Fusobacterium sp.]|uniref:hypothetical protein n=1 Tax=uncultured Fusobacterium sp. TaxID=159267 RepID=UPI0015A6B368|nr:hypothetical protein [uncultured Fusobacterium sp.]
MWICKECGCAKFKITKIEETEREVVFDKDGIEDESKEIYSNTRETLECANCGNSGSIFHFIEDIAEWVEEK